MNSDDIVHHRGHRIDCRGCPTCRGSAGATGATGATGSAGPTGATGNAGCCKIGVLPLFVLDPTLLSVTPAMLQNPGHPGATYAVISFSGPNKNNARVVLPQPASELDSDTIILENRTDNLLIITIDPTLGDGFSLLSFGKVEASLEQEIQDGAKNSRTYRTEVLLRPGGAYRVPGFTLTG